MGVMSPEYQRQWKAENREHYLESLKDWRRRNPDYEKNRGRVRTRESRRKEWLKAKYGLTVQQYLEMAEAQGQKCPLCERVCAKSESRESGLHVDHDHVTGEIRGLLCGQCNKVLGKLGDSLEGVERFAARVRSYLERA